MNPHIGTASVNILNGTLEFLVSAGPGYDAGVVEDLEGLVRIIRRRGWLLTGAATAVEG